ncbi:MAG: conjugal transfer protein TraA [Candidatus Thiodiazotropha endolucinida]|nr:conjugal transfer protein TraA [Candidatus Thiodiazotropha taylori]MCW4225205.1 conjugal transfer protein TraA [Candidatus Thiodiazotropha endolucinida]MCG7880757.1 conjugal transfer protein TraA [Candidatus Thiodiazotropha taylori]MCG7886776.1 conjugal transfer protein TraA [Candidatus Thiodiazotropha taylori]MCG8028164.1 conjugal transfer protein TraA [Candidatus Thiodiazotropha taylori]
MINQANIINNTTIIRTGIALLFFIGITIIPEQASAGTGGTEFQDVWDTVKEYMQGLLGRIVAGAMILVGIVAGVARQSLMSFAIGVGGGVGLYNTPTVIENIMTATIKQVPTEANTIIPIFNGLGM